MKVLSAKEIKQADEYTIRSEPIQSLDLMERASNAFVEIFTKHFKTQNEVKVFCGMGNNGGDGLAISRLLLNRGYHLKTYIVKNNNEGTPDFNSNLKRLLDLITVENIVQASDIPLISENEVVIDALFGTGLTRPVTGIAAETIVIINKSGAAIVSVDIASGLPADLPLTGDQVVRPYLTITFQVPKLAFFIPENEQFVGKWQIADIGLNKQFIDNTLSKNFYTTTDYIFEHLKKRKKFAHKGDFGKALIISGSFGKMGAAVLCAKACLRSGIGLLTLHIPRCGYEIVQTAVPEAMVSIDNEKNFISGYPDFKGFTAIGIGPGIGTNEGTVNMLGKLLENTLCPMVLDADALNIISRNKYLLDHLPSGSILTPHLAEFERLSGTFNNHFERIESQRQLSAHLKVVIILKGAHTSVSLPDGSVYFNSTGNPGMAKGGTGDILTGIVTALLSQKYPSEVAAILGVYLHGLAADIAVKSKSEESLIASDIIESLPDAFKISRE
jgi:hydroxyethylthiazole kinase-like uncharacterized protein yjeF